LLTNSPPGAPLISRHLGILQVHQARLAAALEPSPQRCISEVHSLLPDLARAACRAFVADVRSLADAVARPPGSAEEFVAHLELVRRVEARRQELDRRHDDVSAVIWML
jgi:hypothetical protein